MPHPRLGVSPPDMDIYARIGMVASEWAYVEMLLDKALAYFLGAVPGATYVITQTVANASVVQWLRTLADIQLQIPENLQILSTLLNDIDAARAERNTIVHGAWRAGPVLCVATVQTFRWGRTEVFRDEVHSTQDVDDFVAELHQIQERLLDVAVSLGYL